MCVKHTELSLANSEHGMLPTFCCCNLSPAPCIHLLANKQRSGNTELDFLTGLNLLCLQSIGDISEMTYVSIPDTCVLYDLIHHSFLRRSWEVGFCCLFLFFWSYLANSTFLLPYSTDPGALCHFLEIILKFLRSMKMS